MTGDSPTISGERADEVARFVDAVRQHLRDLPPAQRENLLEDLPAHLTEVAAEDPAPLHDRLGDPAGYAADLRAAVNPAGPPRRSLPARVRAAARDRLVERLRRLDSWLGPLIGYERASEFGRLLVPAWWVLRGYLAAMIAVSILAQQEQVGLLPRLGGSTVAGVVILAAFVAGSIWLARREPHLAGWRRRMLLAGSALVAVIGLAGFVSADAVQRWTSPRVEYVSANPYGHIQDVYVVDGNGRLLTGVTLRDQDGNVIELGWFCEDQFDAAGRPVITYPRCPGELPWWLPPGSTVVTPTPPSSPSPWPSPTGTPAPSPSVTASPEVDAAG